MAHAAVDRDHPPCRPWGAPPSSLTSSDLGHHRAEALVHRPRPARPAGGGPARPLVRRPGSGPPGWRFRRSLPALGVESRRRYSIGSLARRPRASWSTVCSMAKKRCGFAPHRAPPTAPARPLIWQGHPGRPTTGVAFKIGPSPWPLRTALAVRPLRRRDRASPLFQRSARRCDGANGSG